MWRGSSTAARALGAPCRLRRARADRPPAPGCVGMRAPAAAELASQAALRGGCAGFVALGHGASGTRSARRRTPVTRAAGAAAEEAAATVEELNARWAVDDAVHVGVGVAGMTRVLLVHSNGSRAGVYLHGANVTSWVISNGSDVLFVRPDTPLDGVKPISGGIPICWPQFGPGGDSPGGIPGQPAMQQHGFARNMDWEICGTGLTPDEREPFVRLRLRDTPYSRAMWDHAFELEYVVTLGTRNLGLQLTARNTGKSEFAFTAALHSYIGVENVREDNVMLLGLQGTTYIDKMEDPTQPVVRQETAPVHHIRGPTDKVFVSSPPRVALEVGTGCTVFVENTAGFTDHVVWNPWTANMHYPNFVCVENGVVGAPVRLAPAEEWVGQSALFVRDITLSTEALDSPAPEED